MLCWLIGHKFEMCANWVWCRRCAEAVILEPKSNRKQVSDYNGVWHRGVQNYQNSLTAQGK